MRFAALVLLVIAVWSVGPGCQWYDQVSPSEQQAVADGVETVLSSTQMSHWMPVKMRACASHCGLLAVEPRQTSTGVVRTAFVSRAIRGRPLMATANDQIEPPPPKSNFS